LTSRKKKITLAIRVKKCNGWHKNTSEKTKLLGQIYKKKLKLTINRNNIVTKFQPFLMIIHWDFYTFTIIFEKIM